MTKFDKFLGLLILAGFGLLYVGPRVHWLSLASLAAAAIVYILFVVPVSKKRCNLCGHYFPQNVFEWLTSGKRKRRQGTLQTEPRLDTAAATSKPDDGHTCK